jgi:hypothetical protein
MSKSSPKNVGVSLAMLPDADTAKYLREVAHEATFAENAIWHLWRKYDPVLFTDVQRMTQEREQTGKWPKLPKYVLSNTPEGPTPTKIAKALCPNLGSYVYDSIANSVRRLYLKQRWELLWHKRSLPTARSLRIRFRERAVQIIEWPWVDKKGRAQDGYAIRCCFKKSETCVIPIRTDRQNGWVQKWLKQWSTEAVGPSGGTVYQKTIKGQKKWFIALARCRGDAEIVSVKSPVANRVCLAYAPLPEVREEFLLLDVKPTPDNRLWRQEVEAHDILRTKMRWADRNRRQGRNFQQSREVSAAHGHGWRRRLRSKMPAKGRYENRCKSWIENRSRAIVDFAVNARCSEILMENLSERDSRTLRLGEFPYHQFMLRIQQKAETSGLKFRKFKDLESICKQFGVTDSGFTDD